jgi:hypothetical protein
MSSTRQISLFDNFGDGITATTSHTWLGKLETYQSNVFQICSGHIFITIQYYFRSKVTECVARLKKKVLNIGNCQECNVLYCDVMGSGSSLLQFYWNILSPPSGLKSTLITCRLFAALKLWRWRQYVPPNISELLLDFMASHRRR